MSHYKPYPAYKESGVEWLGQVPEHWAVKPLKYAAVLTTGFTPPTDNPGNYAEHGFGWFRPDDLDDSGAPAVASKYLSAEGRQYVRKIPAGSVLICCIGTIGKVGFNLDVASTNQQITAATFHSGSRYFFYAALAARKSFEVAAAGNVLQILNNDRLGAIKFPNPPIEEAKKIVSLLDRETARIDALISKKTRFIELLREKRQALITHAVTKGLDPSVKMKDSGVEWLGEVPEHWKLMPLKYVTPSLTVGIVVNPSDYVAEEGLPFLYGGDISDGEIFSETARRISVEDSARNAKTKLMAGDLVTVRVGAPGVTAVVPPECEGGNCASVMLIRRGHFESDWLCYLMNSRVVRYQVEVVQYGAAQEQFNISHAVDFLIPVPSREEQAEIASSLNHERQRVDVLLRKTERSIELLKERRSALITAAVTGKIDLREILEI